MVRILIALRCPSHRGGCHAELRKHVKIATGRRKSSRSDGLGPDAVVIPSMVWALNRPGMRGASIRYMSLTRISKLAIPADHYEEDALVLQYSQHLCDRLRAAPAVVAVWPNGSRQVVWGLDCYSSYAYPAGGNAASLTTLMVPPVPR